METIAARLKRLRKAIGLTQAELATKAGISQSAIGNIESGAREYGQSVVNIAKILGESPDYLLCTSDRGGVATGVAVSADARPKEKSDKTLVKWPFPTLAYSEISCLQKPTVLKLEGEIRAWIHQIQVREHEVQSGAKMKKTA